MQCPTCGEDELEDHQFCQNCLTNLYAVADDKRRIPMSDWEKLKLSFYRSDKTWADNIRNRRRVTARDGSTIVVSGNRPVPIPPKSIWAPITGGRK